MQKYFVNILIAELALCSVKEAVDIVPDVPRLVTIILLKTQLKY